MSYFCQRCQFADFLGQISVRLFPFLGIALNLIECFFELALINFESVDF